MRRTYLGTATFTNTKGCGRVLVDCQGDDCNGDNCTLQLCDKTAPFKTFYGAYLCADHWDEDMKDPHLVAMEKKLAQT